MFDSLCSNPKSGSFYILGRNYVPERCRNRVKYRFRFPVIRKFSRTCSWPCSPSRRAISGCDSRKRIWYAVPSIECVNKPVCLCITCNGIPPAAEATTGFFFQRASATVSPKPSRWLF